MINHKPMRNQCVRVYYIFLQIITPSFFALCFIMKLVVDSLTKSFKFSELMEFIVLDG